MAVRFTIPEVQISIGTEGALYPVKLASSVVLAPPSNISCAAMPSPVVKPPSNLELEKMKSCFYRTHVHMGSDHWVALSLSIKRF